MSEITEKTVESQVGESCRNETVFSNSDKEYYEFGKAFYDLISLLLEVDIDDEI